MTADEIKQIDGYENYYVSKSGKVFSRNKELRQYSNKGYSLVYLYKDTKRKKYFVHRLVATAFIPNPENYPFVNHKDENPKNNNVMNLEWCTAKYNTNYGSCIEKRANNCKKRILQIDDSGNVVSSFNGIIDAAKAIGLDASSISKAALGKRKKAGGYRWIYDS